MSSFLFSFLTFSNFQFCIEPKVHSLYLAGSTKSLPCLVHINDSAVKADFMRSKHSLVPISAKFWFLNVTPSILWSNCILGERWLEIMTSTAEDVPLKSTLNIPYQWLSRFFFILKKSPVGMNNIQYSHNKLGKKNLNCNVKIC